MTDLQLAAPEAAGTANAGADPRVTLWQLTMLVLSVFVLGLTFVETVFTLPQEIGSMLIWIDNAICILFLGDFAYNVITAKDRRAYLKWGWIDLVSSIPHVQIFRWGRLARIIRIIRIMRSVRSTRTILRVLFTNRAKGTFATVALISFAMVIFSAIAILNCETAPTSNIQTSTDAIWWAFTTISTVGYGDRFPVTPLGRVIAGALMTVGVGLFGTFTAYVATFFIQQDEKEEAGREQAILAELREIRRLLEQANEDGGRQTR